jgi:hypothetical protein
MPLSIVWSLPAAQLLVLLPVLEWGVVGRSSPTAMPHEHSIWNHLGTSSERVLNSICVDLLEVRSISHVCASRLACACAQNMGVPALCQHSPLLN